MFAKVKDWFVNAISNGGAILVLGAVIVAGGVSHVAHDPLQNFFAPSSPSASAPLPDTYECPSEDWLKIPGYDEQLGATYTTCELNKIVIRHFDIVPVDPNIQQTLAMDKGVYPFNTELTVEEAVEIANSR